MVTKKVFIKILLVRRLMKRLRRKERSCYVRQLFLSRNDQDNGLLQQLRDDPHYHQRFFRMNGDNFDELLSLIADDLQHAKNHAVPISPLERLAITLRYLASGDSQISLALCCRISPSSVSNILKETVGIICKTLGPKFLPSPGEDTWQKSSERYKGKWQFPNVCGALDGKHIRIKAPPSSGSLYYNYKNFFSIVLLAICNADWEFVAIDIGAYGSESDGGILAKSSMGKKLFEDNFGFPQPRPISEGGEPLPYVILADDAFPLKTNLLKPYKGSFLSNEENVFNYRLSRARMTIENSFGLLSARWRIFHRTIEADVVFAKQIVLAATLLHNFLLSKKDFSSISLDSYDDQQIQEGNWRAVTESDTGMLRLSRQGSNNHSHSASEVRNQYRNYFVSPEGAVSWQNAKVSAGL